MQKEIKKVKYVGMWDDFKKENFFIHQILEKKYEVQVCSDADYVICSCFGMPYSYLNHKGIRILFSGENYTPDFNFVDYALGVDNIVFNDRYIRVSDSLNLELSLKKRNFTKKDLNEKEHFANFIFGHESEFKIRGDFFKQLCKYKKVESVGRYLNNSEDGFIIKRADKLGFQKKCKFTLCFESTSIPDFCTEKIVDAFLADTIPVYYGDPNVTKTFNPKAFINVADYPSVEDAINKIIELDNDDEKYIQMLNQPVYLDGDIVKKKNKEIEDFIYNIFDMPLSKAKRRSTVYVPAFYEKSLKTLFNKYYYKSGTLKQRVKLKLYNLKNRKKIEARKKENGEK